MWLGLKSLIWKTLGSFKSTSQTHRVPVRLKEGGKGTTAYWAISPAGKLVLFVHGFGGEATGTWKDFPSLLLPQRQSRGCDFIFYGYDGLRARSLHSANLLLDFLVAFLPKPSTVINATIEPSACRLDTFSYSKIILVAHSLGALVCRQALLEAVSENRPWLAQVHLILFAPAHMGADVIALASDFMGTFRVPVGPAAKLAFPPLIDLEPGSETLKRLSGDTHRALASGIHPYLVARTVILGERDNIVSPNRFCSDPRPRVYRRKSHKAVCKPSDKFLNPVFEVLGIL